MINKISYYEVLSVSPQASDNEIRRAYHVLAKQFHPDHNPQNRKMAELRFRIINEAYAHLKTMEARKKYNRTLRMKAGNDNTNPNKRGFFSQIGEIFWPQKTDGHNGHNGHTS